MGSAALRAPNSEESEQNRWSLFCGGWLAQRRRAAEGNTLMVFLDILLGVTDGGEMAERFASGEEQRSSHDYENDSNGRSFDVGNASVSDCGSVSLE